MISTSTTELSTHQEAFIRDVLESPKNSLIILQADVGLGKTTALCAVACAAVRRDPDGTVLALMPAATVDQCSYVMRRFGVDAQIIDRYRFREMLDTHGRRDFWERGGVYLMSREFAKRPDVVEKLTESKWSMVVADEVQDLTTLQGRDSESAQGKLLRSVARVSGKVVVASRAGNTIDVSTLDKQVLTIVWDRDEILRAANIERPPLLEVVRVVHPSVPEVELQHLVEELANAIEDVHEYAAQLLRRSAKSGAAALEESVRRLLSATTASAYDTDGLDTVSPLFASVEARELDEVREQLHNILAIAETNASDAKADAVRAILAELRDNGEADARVCIVTNYIATMYYLVEMLAAGGYNSSLLHGALGSEAAQLTVTNFAANGGIIIASRASLARASFDLKLSDVILYDNSRFDKEVVARFDRIGRTTPLRIYRLVAAQSENSQGDDLAD